MVTLVVPTDHRRCAFLTVVAVLVLAPGAVVRLHPGCAFPFLVALVHRRAHTTHPAHATHAHRHAALAGCGREAARDRGSQRAGRAADSAVLGRGQVELGTVGGVHVQATGAALVKADTATATDAPATTGQARPGTP